MRSYSETLDTRISMEQARKMLHTSVDSMMKTCPDAFREGGATVAEWLQAASYIVFHFLDKSGLCVRCLKHKEECDCDVKLQSEGQPIVQ